MACRSLVATTVGENRSLRLLGLIAANFADYNRPLRGSPWNRAALRPMPRQPLAPIVHHPSTLEFRT
jgi:hypothetical protein